MIYLLQNEFPFPDTFGYFIPPSTSASLTIRAVDLTVIEGTFIPFLDTKWTNKYGSVKMQWWTSHRLHLSWLYLHCWGPYWNLLKQIISNKNCSWRFISSDWEVHSSLIAGLSSILFPTESKERMRLCSSSISEIGQIRNAILPIQWYRSEYDIAQ